MDIKRTLNEIFHGKYKHFLTLFAFFIVLAWFDILEKFIVPRYIMYSRADSFIPFIKEFVLAYCLWYIYLVAGVWYLGVVSRKDFFRVYAFLFSGMSIACTIYMIFPNVQHLRPVITQHDIFSLLIKGIYSADTPTNVCPSIHVINTLGVHLGIVNCDKLKEKHGLKLVSLICAVLICMSTLFIKQHSVIDVTAALAVSAVLYACIYQVPKLFGRGYERVLDIE